VNGLARGRRIVELPPQVLHPAPGRGDVAEHGLRLAADAGYMALACQPGVTRPSRT
jgi:hypothetical protein